ncbi:uncharacterized protein LOC130727651 isoform X2 [Lotus japonicus]|uniref:uncharacterized protein LOC130727651 isoform X2 n=1 Tax=Lotus japonicus TaxID=34305 RepID=UPI00258E4BA7|nr:uncharacterized protein LOC130727651 isoform X2 [Lotus japonicus]
MASSSSMDLEQTPQVQENVAEGTEKVEVENEIRSTEKKKKKKGRSYFPRPKLMCFRVQHDVTGEGFDMDVVDASGQRPNPPTHLIIMVNGLIGSAHDWKFAAKQFLARYPNDTVVHCSERNTSILTLDGVDVLGERLAEEVIQVIKRHPSVQKISFVGHSLGGLIARYAIAKLYGRDISKELSQGNGHSESEISSDQECHAHDRKYEGKIAGLEPINYISSASPHLGSRGHRQVPMFCGFRFLEKTAYCASWFLGKTGKHLFLADCKKGKSPLLLQMARDTEDIKFLSALRSFKHRVAYANVRYDQLVGWSTSSLRRRNELPKRRHLSRHEDYPHIVNVEPAKPISVPVEVPTEPEVNSGSSKIDWEEEMIRGLTSMSWDRVDVSFRGIKQSCLAHTTIQVNTYNCMNSDGADVVQHMVDTFQL